VGVVGWGGGKPQRDESANDFFSRGGSVHHLMEAVNLREELRQHNSCDIREKGTGLWVCAE